ncbi:hypothetical protein SynSYN20_00930 [Synechococcus sp. SYN20]|nr:hypothetical protein SynSYN20_00930 [Synechococcus sp. SYN20]
MNKPYWSNNFFGSARANDQRNRFRQFWLYVTKHTQHNE